VTTGVGCPVTAAGVLLTAIVHCRRPILAITIAATGLSLIAPITAPDDTATSMVLVATHLVAAAIVIPARDGNWRLGRVRLSDPRRGSAGLVQFDCIP
jgi:hypothetical protein